MDGRDANDEHAPELTPVEKPRVAPSADALQGQSAPESQSDEEQDYAVANKETADYSHVLSVVGEPKPRKSRHWFLVIIVLLLVGGGAADWWFFIRQKPAPAKPTAARSQQAPSQDQSTTGTKHYDSSDFDLAFDYPEKWPVSDKGDGKLTVTSPAMQLTDATGQPQTGEVVVGIQKKDAADFSAFKQGSAVAVLDSQKVNYTKPTSTQRKSTYISYLQYAATATHGALDSVYITGDFGYKYGQNIPESDLLKLDPLITVRFYACTGAKCSGKPTPLSIQSSSWPKDATAKQLMTMLQSLQVR